MWSRKNLITVTGETKNQEGELRNVDVLLIVLHTWGASLNAEVAEVLEMHCETDFLAKNLSQNNILDIKDITNDWRYSEISDMVIGIKWI